MNDQIVQRDEKRKRIKRTRRRQIRTRLGTGAAVIAGIIVFLLLFQLRDIRVRGNDFLTDSEVSRYIREQGGDGNSLVLLLSTKLGDYPEPPTVESMEVHMVNPWTIWVDVTETS